MCLDEIEGERESKKDRQTEERSKKEAWSVCLSVLVKSVASLCPSEEDRVSLSASEKGVVFLAVSEEGVASLSLNQGVWPLSLCLLVKMAWYLCLLVKKAWSFCLLKFLFLHVSSWRGCGLFVSK